MNINRHNYEEFFILYMDNELGAEERREVEIFIEKNPDLKEELDILMQYKLVPDSNIVFTNKTQLIRPEGSSMVNLVNYEEWMILYHDGELTMEQQIAVEDFIKENPETGKTFQILSKTKVQPEPIIFQDKDSLYRTEEKVRRMPVRWWRIAVAAILILTAGYFAFTINDKKPASETKDIAKDNSPVQNKSDNQAKENISKEKADEIIPKPEIASVNNEVQPQSVNKTRVVPNNSNDDQKNTGKTDLLATEKKKTVIVPIEVKPNEKLLADANKKVQTNNLPQPVNNPNLNNLKNDIAIASANPLKQEDVKSNNTVTTHPTEASAIYASNNEDAGYTQPGGKKSKLRGLLRKVTRTFEKTTNISATDDEDRVLIGGLAIKLK